MMSQHSVSLEIDANQVAWISLDRPDKHNALSLVMMRELTEIIQQVGRDEAIRAVVLTGKGDSFCAGADLKWMQSSLDRPRADRIADSNVLARMLASLDQCPKLVIGRINGQAYGGGIGLISVCDVAIGLESSNFTLSEVKLGLVPANIAPYLLRKIGTTNTRRLALTARRFDGREAVAFGLLAAAVSVDKLDQAIEAELELALGAAPKAIARTKALLSELEKDDLDNRERFLAEALADTWAQADTQAGIRAFFTNTAPPWKRSLKIE